MLDKIMTYGPPLAILAIGVSDTTAGFIFRASILIWPTLAGWMDDNTFTALVHLSF